MNALHVKRDDVFGIRVDVRCRAGRFDEELRLQNRCRYGAPQSEGPLRVGPDHETSRRLSPKAQGPSSFMPGRSSFSVRRSSQSRMPESGYFRSTWGTVSDHPPYRIKVRSRFGFSGPGVALIVKVPAIHAGWNRTCSTAALAPMASDAQFHCGGRHDDVRRSLSDGKAWVYQSSNEVQPHGAGCECLIEGKYRSVELAALDGSSPPPPVPGQRIVVRVQPGRPVHWRQAPLASRDGAKVIVGLLLPAGANERHHLLKGLLGDQDADRRRLVAHAYMLGGSKRQIRVGGATPLSRMQACHWPSGLALRAKPSGTTTVPCLVLMTSIDGKLDPGPKIMPAAASFPVGTCSMLSAGAQSRLWQHSCGYQSCAWARKTMQATMMPVLMIFRMTRPPLGSAFRPGLPHVGDHRIPLLVELCGHVGDRPPCSPRPSANRYGSAARPSARKGLAFPWSK